MGFGGPSEWSPCGKSRATTSPTRRPMAAPKIRRRGRGGDPRMVGGGDDLPATLPELDASPVPPRLDGPPSKDIPRVSPLQGLNEPPAHLPRPGCAPPVLLGLAVPQPCPPSPQLTIDEDGHEVPSWQGQGGGQDQHPELWDREGHPKGTPCWGVQLGWGPMVTFMMRKKVKVP